MDYQAVYDDLDNLIKNIDDAIDEIKDKKTIKNIYAIKHPQIIKQKKRRASQTEERRRTK